MNVHVLKVTLASLPEEQKYVYADPRFSQVLMVSIPFFVRRFPFFEWSSTFSLKIFPGFHDLWLVVAVILASVEGVADLKKFPEEKEKGSEGVVQLQQTNVKKSVVAMPNDVEEHNLPDYSNVIDNSKSVKYLPRGETNTLCNIDNCGTTEPPENSQSDEAIHQDHEASHSNEENQNN